MTSTLGIEPVEAADDKTLSKNIARFGRSICCASTKSGTYSLDLAHIS